MHSIDDLLGIAYRYYPGEIPSYEPRYRETEEYLRLAAARRHAGAHHEPWRAMLRRLAEQFPEQDVQNRSLHLPTGGCDACYSGAIHLPKAPGEHHHAVGFFVSFLVPYYLVYSSRLVDAPEAAEPARSSPSGTIDVYRGDTCWVLPAEAVTPELQAELEKQDREAYTDATPFVPDLKVLAEKRRQQQLVRFDLTPDEQPYTASIARDIEATFGCERMPPEVGNVVVPDVETNSRRFGETRLYDCLLSDDW
jgi:hypothetical protein